MRSTIFKGVFPSLISMVIVFNICDGILGRA